MLQINNMPKLDLGIQGEAGVNPIEINMEPWEDELEGGTVQLLHKRHGDATASAVTSADYDSDTAVLTWTPSSTDTAYEGEGEAVITMTIDSQVKKSRTITTIVRPTI